MGALFLSFRSLRVIAKHSSAGACPSVPSQVAAAQGFYTFSTRFFFLVCTTVVLGSLEREVVVGPNERIFKPEYAEELLGIAHSDLVTAKALINAKGVRPENTLFHVEQAIEKALKAVLCSKSLPIPLTHDLNLLIDRLAPIALPPGGYALNDLTPFATIRRYEEGKFLITGDDINNSVSCADAVLAWASRILAVKS
jgi:HEPN domain-containing protein